MKNLALVTLLLIVIAGCQQQRVEGNSPEFDKKKGKILFQGKLFTGVKFYNYRDTKQLSEETSYKEGVIDGIERGWYSNGKIHVESHYKNGQGDGLWKAWYENGQLKYETNVLDGQMNGLSKSWYENGQLSRESNFRNGIQDGVTKDLFENGQLKYERHWLDGELDGLSKEGYENGQLAWEALHKNTEIIQLKNWDDNGWLLYEGTFKKNRYTNTEKAYYKGGSFLTGKQNIWYDNGQLKNEINWKDGDKDGLSNAWNEDGQLRYEGTYENNVFKRKYKEGETKNSEFIDPRDGQKYKTIDIGTQTWFAENLNNKTANSLWYKDSKTNGDVYGSLYNWDEANNTCPDGWHLPTEQEWRILERQVGMSEEDLVSWSDYRGKDEGSKLKSKSGWKPYWNHDNNNGTNSSGFNALPGGYYDDHYRKFSDIGYRGQWWSSSEVTPDYTAYQVYRKICNSSDRIRKDDNYSKLNCKSVRCLKD